MKQPFAIAAPARQEANYLLEWIAYHRSLGIRLFLLGDNGGDDGTSEPLQELDRLRLIRRLPWLNQRYFQLNFCHRVLQLTQGLIEGLFFIDVDEFLRPSNPNSMVSDIAGQWLATESIGAVAINWAVYGSSGHEQIARGSSLSASRREPPGSFLSTDTSNAL